MVGFARALMEKFTAKKYENSKEKIIFVYVHKSSILPV